MQEADETFPLAIKCGRIVFVLVGSILLLVAGFFSINMPNEKILLSATCMGVGLFLIWSAFVLPKKWVAHLGFFLPWFLPEE